MFRAMRRKKQLLSREASIAILERCTAGVLAVTGDEGYPYAVPVSYAYHDGKLFFHSAVEGHKLDGILRNDKVTFCVIDRDEVIQKTFTTHYRSVIVFGRARILTDDHEKRFALQLLAEKYSPDFLADAPREIDGAWKRVCSVEITIEHMTGKAAKEIIDLTG